MQDVQHRRIELPVDHQRSQRIEHDCMLTRSNVVFRYRLLRWRWRSRNNFRNLEAAELDALAPPLNSAEGMHELPGKRHRIPCFIITAEGVLRFRSSCRPGLGTTSRRFYPSRATSQRRFHGCADRLPITIATALWPRAHPELRQSRARCTFHLFFAVEPAKPQVVPTAEARHHYTSFVKSGPCNRSGSNKSTTLPKQTQPRKQCAH